MSLVSGIVLPINQIWNNTMKRRITLITLGVDHLWEIAWNPEVNIGE